MLTRHAFCEGDRLAVSGVLQYLRLLTLLQVVALLWCHFNTAVTIIKAVIPGVDILVRSWGQVCRSKIREQ